MSCTSADDVVIGSKLYLLGGLVSGGNKWASCNQAYQGIIGTEGAISGFKRLETGFGIHRMSCSVEVIGKDLYVIGGDDDFQYDGREPLGIQDTLERAPTAADGELGPFEAVPMKLIRKWERCLWSL